MANILADKLYILTSHFKRRLKIIVSNVTVSNVTFCPSKKDTIAAWKNTTSWISIHLIWLKKKNVKIAHAFALNLSSNSFKTMFLVGESRYQSYVHFQALKRRFLAKIMFFSDIL